jgi:CBS domain-containing protein
MTPAEDLITISESDPINKAMEIMTENRIKHLPVFKENKLVGLVSIGDLVKSMLEKSRQETKRLQDYISGDYPEE